jgi:type I restriction enzyme R subunit
MRSSTGSRRWWPRSGSTSQPIEEPEVIQGEQADEPYEPAGEQPPIDLAEPPAEPRKFYFDGGQVAIAAHLVYELDSSGRQLRVVRFTDYTAERVRTLFPTAAELRRAWTGREERQEVRRLLAERGIDLDELAQLTDQPEADPLDLLCHVAFNAPLRTRRERAERLRRERRDFFDRFGPEAREVLQELLEKHADHGIDQFALPDVLMLPPINRHGNVLEIVRRFGDEDHLASAVHELEDLLYAA